MSNIFDDIVIDLNFQGDHTNQQCGHLRHYFDTAEFNREFSVNDENDKTLRILNMNIRSTSMYSLILYITFFTYVKWICSPKHNFRRKLLISCPETHRQLSKSAKGTVFWDLNILFNAVIVIQLCRLAVICRFLNRQDNGY